MYKDRDDCYIFEGNEGSDAPPAYQSEEERRTQNRMHLGIGNDVQSLLCVVIWSLYFAFANTLFSLAETGMLLPLIVIILFVLTRSVINIAYVKGRGSVKLIKIQDIQNRIFGAMIFLVLVYSLFWSVKMIGLGDFAGVWNLAAGEFYYRLLLLSVPMAVPLFLLGQAVTLLGKKLILGDVIYALALIGVLGAFCS